MPVTPIDAAATLRKRAEERRAVASRRAEALRSRLPHAKEVLVRSYGARRVVLFGSMAGPDPGPHSDVDLAVEGLAPARFFAAMADVTTAMGCTVDLVRLEEAPPSLRDRIAAEGREL